MSISFNDLNGPNVSDASGNTTLGSLSSQNPNGQNLNNTAVGFGALRDNAGGQHNIAVGLNALANNSASNNVAIGENALYNFLAPSTTQTGTLNVAVGNNAMQSNASGNQNVAVGNQALHNNTTGSDNIGIGCQAFNADTAGNNNVGIGSRVSANNHNSCILLGNGAQTMANNEIGVGGINLATASPPSAIAGYLPVRMNNSTISNKLYYVPMCDDTSIGGVITAVPPLQDLNPVAGTNEISIAFTAVKGEIPAGTGNAKTGALVAAPTTNGYVLTADNTTVTGLSWKHVNSGGGTTINRNILPDYPNIIPPPVTANDTMICVSDKYPSWQNVTIPLVPQNAFCTVFAPASDTTPARWYSARYDTTTPQYIIIQCSNPGSGMPPKDVIQLSFEGNPPSQCKLNGMTYTNLDGNNSMIWFWGGFTRCSQVGGDAFSITMNLGCMNNTTLLPIPISSANTPTSYMGPSKGDTQSTNITTNGQIYDCKFASKTGVLVMVGDFDGLAHESDTGNDKGLTGIAVYLIRSNLFLTINQMNAQNLLVTNGFPYTVQLTDGDTKYVPMYFGGTFTNVGLAPKASTIITPYYSKYDNTSYDDFPWHTDVAGTTLGGPVYGSKYSAVQPSSILICGSFLFLDTNAAYYDTVENKFVPFTLPNLSNLSYSGGFGCVASTKFGQPSGSEYDVVALCNPASTTNPTLFWRSNVYGVWNDDMVSTVTNNLQTLELNKGQGLFNYADNLYFTALNNTTASIFNTRMYLLSIPQSVFTGSFETNSSISPNTFTTLTLRSGGALNFVASNNAPFRWILLNSYTIGNPGTFS
jgi:hypothetical protein